MSQTRLAHLVPQCAQLSGGIMNISKVRAQACQEIGLLDEMASA